ncbi:hypothetical protein [Georgenia thermotolerans]|uniref:hypothetical protein n=1 Tax=Georgenia thermotolerans TaxID=527326 RepID=UPI00126435E9|nr:hypothetical protein [Georgenia thermotolerans]
MTNLTAATEARQLAQAQLEQADKEWRQAIREEVARGKSYAQIAEVAGITRGRVAQIIHENR